MMRNKLLLANFNYLRPFSGTRPYRRLERKGRLCYPGGWWIGTSHRFGEVAFEPRGMSAAWLAAEAWRIRAAFPSYPSSCTGCSIGGPTWPVCPAS